MIVTQSEPLEELIRRTIMGYIEKEAQKVADGYKEKAIKDLDLAIRMAVTDTAVTLSKMIDVTNGGDRLTITISDRKSK